MPEQDEPSAVLRSDELRKRKEAAKSEGRRLVAELLRFPEGQPK